jgi:diguanylate cyclase (GGDEF)-like protein
MSHQPLLQRRIDRELVRLTLLGTTLATLLLAVVVALVERESLLRTIQTETQQTERDLLEQITSSQSVERVQRQMQIKAASAGLALAALVNPQGLVIAANDAALVGEPFRRALLDPLSDHDWADIQRCLPRSHNRSRQAACPQPFGRWLVTGTSLGGNRWLSLIATPLALAEQPGLERNGLLVLSFDLSELLRGAIVSVLITVGSGLVLLLLTSGTLVWTVRRQLLERLVQLARIDTTTGLLNREALLEELEPWLAERQASQEPILLAIAGLDRFKDVNSRHGYGGGDRVLTEVSGLLRKALKPGEWAGRLSGDQFALCFRGGTAEVDRLRALCHELEQERWEAEPGHTVALTLSVGVASSGGPAGWALNLLLAQADRNLRLAKQEGGNRVINR